jgi:hypothetical protein
MDFSLPDKLAPIVGKQNWLRKTGQVDKGIVCLTTTTLAEDQEIRLLKSVKK